MYIILGILGVILVILEEYILGLYLDFSVLGLSFFVVIPAGACLIGMFLGWILSIGTKKSRKLVSKVSYVTAALIAITVFFGIGYMEYKTTYINYSYELNRTGDGTPIGEISYTDEDGIERNMNYLNYVKFTLDNCESTLRFKGGKSIDVNTSGTLNYISYFLQLIVIILSTLISLKSKTDELTYCENCTEYYKTKKLYKFTRRDYDSEVNELKSRLESYEGIIEFIGKARNKNKENMYYRVELQYCENCKRGKIIIKEFNAKNANEVIENRENINIDSGIVQMIIES